MSLHNCKILLALILSFFLAINPLMAAASPINTGSACSAQFLFNSNNSDYSGNAFLASTVSYFNNMFATANPVPNPYEAELPELVEEAGLLDPLIEKTGAFFSGILDDEEFELILNSVLEEIASDERLLAFDQDELLVRILRDERLAEILGNSIAKYLRDDDLLDLINWLTDEVTRLIKDEQFAFFIKNAIRDFLGDERIVYFIQDIMEIFIEVPESIIESLQNDERLGRVLADILDLVLIPVEGMMEDLINDDRVTGAVDAIVKNLESLPEAFLEDLLEDEKFQTSVGKLQETLMGIVHNMVDEFLETMATEEVLKNFLDELMLLLEEEESFIRFMEVLDYIAGELADFAAQIGEEVEKVMDIYAEDPGGGGGGARGGAGGAEGGGSSIAGEEEEEEEEERSPIDDIMDESVVEDQIADFFEYWAETLGEIFLGNLEELEAVIEQYIDEDSPYIGAVTDAVSGAAENSLEMFMDDMAAVLEDHLSDYPIEEILQKYEEEISLVLEENLENASFDELLFLIEDKQEIFGEVLEDIISTLPVETIVNGARNDEDLARILDDIIVELPYDAIADLLSEEELEVIIEGIYDIINELPLDNLAAFLQENADTIGQTAATTILNGIADSIEAPEEPPDPRREAIMEALLSEERMHRFYIDLGADPETLTPESDTASVIIGIIMDSIEKNDRMEEFRESVEKRAEPVEDELSDYGTEFGARLRYYAGRILSPLERFFDPIRRLLTYEREDEEKLRELLKATGLSGGFKWFGGFFTEVLTESSAGGFITGSLSDFFLHYGIVEDIATYERFSVINSFIAEIQGAEELKELEAEYFARDFITSLEKEVAGATDITGLITPGGIASGISDAVAENIPAEPLRLTIEDAGLEADDVIDDIAVTLEELIPEIREMIDEMVIPSLNIPLDFLEDKRALEAVEEIMEHSAKPVVDTLGEILKDPRLTAVISDIMYELHSDITPVLIDDLYLVFDDERTLMALENLIVNFFTDEEVLSSVGNFLGDLLSDEELLLIIEASLYESINESVLGKNAFPFHVAYAEILGIGLIPVEVRHFTTGAFNGLYYFTQVLMEWFRGESPEMSPSEFVRQYPHDYFSEPRIRKNIAEPMAYLLINILGDLTTDPHLYDLVFDRINAALNKDPLGIMGTYLQEDDRLSSLLGTSVAAFPIDKMVASLRESSLTEAVAALTAGIPLESLVPFVKGDDNIRGIIEDTSVTIDLAPLRALLPIDPGIPEIILNRASNFPASILTGFFNEEDRAYRMGYTIADIESRFAVDLLENPELAQFQRDIILEKLAEADYTIAESFFEGLATFTRNEKLADFFGDLFAGLFDELYLAIRSGVRSMSSALLNSVRNLFAGFFPVFLLIPLAMRKPRLTGTGRSKR